MADFDAIYEEETENEDEIQDANVIIVPDPIVIRGAGNMTVYVLLLCCDSILTEYPLETI